MSKADLYTAETAQQLDELRAQGKRIGFTASCFDLLHAGHVLMLADAAAHCDQLVVALQTDPTIDRPYSKNQPVQSYEERELMLRSIRHVDAIVKYATEADLLQILERLQPDVRILGTDYVGQRFTGDALPIPIHWHRREHDYSTTRLRERIYAAELAKRQQ